MLFTKHDDGRVTVDKWDVRADWSCELLEQADPAMLSEQDGHIVVNVANGSARYRITGCDESRRIVKTVLDATGHGKFLCENCGGQFETAWSQADANAEAERIFGVKNASQQPGMARVCDDCFQMLVGSRLN